MDEIQYQTTYYPELLRKEFGENKPITAVVLGSGLGRYTDQLESDSKRSFAYSAFGFPIPNIPGHAGKLHLGKIAGRNVALLSGRVHYYEGFSMNEVAHSVRMLALAGIERFIITCAVGAIKRCHQPGNILYIKDHIKLVFDSPLREIDEGKFGKRFIDMTNAYDSEWAEQAFQIARKNNYILRAGSLAMMPGPQYETPLEIQILHDLHIIDIVGMSTVPEVIALRAMDKKILGLACVTNMAAGLSEQKLSHKEVMETAAKAEKDFSFLLTEFIKGIPE